MKWEEAPGDHLLVRLLLSHIHSPCRARAKERETVPQKPALRELSPFVTMVTLTAGVRLA